MLAVEVECVSCATDHGEDALTRRRGCLFRGTGLVDVVAVE